jgi:hypothetical protein
MARNNPSLIAFALTEYDRRGWRMPDVHVRIFDWFARTEGERIRVLRVFRGCGKSTILGVRNAHRFQIEPTHQVLAQGADDDLALDLSRDTIAILGGHPWTQGLLREPAGVEQWWTQAGFAASARTPQMRARGVLSRTTGSRADEIQNDDVEVEKNVDSEPARQKLRKKLSEQTHILKPGGSVLFVGTPHAHDSLYDELIKGRAAHLTIPLFASQRRYENAAGRRTFPIGAEPGPDGVWVFAGIGPMAQLLREGHDFHVREGSVKFPMPPEATIDVCTGNAWPERFDREELAHRRQRCRTFNEWDSQYQLEARPTHEIRLDPDRMIAYDVEPVLDSANRQPVLMLGATQIVGFKCWWDVSLGKIRSDASALCIVFTDDAGRLYWHRAQGLAGDLEVLDDDAKLVGGQCHQIIQTLLGCHVHHVTVETNGPGGFVPPILRKHCAPHGITVSEHHTTANKQRRILDAFEPPLSARFLWAHTSVLDGPAAPQMREFNPALHNQPDDYLDAAAGAIRATPVRIGRFVGIPTQGPAQNWSPTSGTHELELEFGAW